MLTSRTLAPFLALVVLSGSLAAQAPLRLADALAEADRHAFANRQAVAAAQSSRAQARLPLKGVLPSARVEGGFVRTTDPIGAFGTTLRQRAVTPAAFDPARLNDPAPVNNVTGGLVLEVPVLNADALAGWRAATAAAEASDAMADWTAISTRAMVVQAYYGAVLAQEKVSMLLQAERAAAAAVRQVESMVTQGLVTKADQLQASVRAADVASQLLAARHDAVTARQQLALLLGRRDTTLVPLPSTLPAETEVRAFVATLPTSPPEPTGADAGADAPAEARADIRAAQLAARAALADHRRATGTLLPRVNGFARYDYNSPTALYAGKPNWTVGVMGTWSLFGGGSELADAAGAAARARSARAAEEAAAATARIDADGARRAVSLALQRLDLATSAAAQSTEAERLVSRRYAGGLATIAELLGAQSAATGATLAQAAARYALISALAQHHRAIGADPGALTQLDRSRSASAAHTSSTDHTP